MHIHFLETIDVASKVTAFEVLRKESSKSIRACLKLAGISKSTYYAKRVREVSSKEKRRILVQEKMASIFEESGSIYGAPKIFEKLKTNEELNGFMPSLSTISRYMKQIDIKPIISTRTSVKNTNNSSGKLIYNNYLAFDRPTSPGTHFVTDMTYIYTRLDGWVYLLSYMDLFTRQIVAFDVSCTMDSKWVSNILERVIANYPNVFMVHSDRGSQYTSETYKSLLLKNDIIQSYSKKGYPYDNAWIESFHKSIKQEKLKHSRISTCVEAYQLCCEYILTFYNSKRIHSALNYKTPNEFADYINIKSA